MASTIVTKNSSTASAVPLTGDLTQGELAVNVTDKRLFTKDSGGTVVELGINPSSLTVKTTLKLSGSSSGYVALQGAAAAGSTTYTLPSADGTNGQALTTNGSGTLAWATISTAAATPTVLGTVYGKMTASGASPYLTALGYNAAPSTTGVNNTAVGYQAFYNNTTGANSTVVGYQAGYTQTTSSAYLTLMGYQSGYNSSGSNTLTGFGYKTLFANTSGSLNNAFGYLALTANTTGNYNVAIGDYALTANTTASNNTAVGYQAAYSSNSTGGTYLGYQTGYSTTSGTYNTFVGYQSGYLVTTGAKNVILGGYNGNQGSLDIRTASNYIVLSDGDGNPRQIIDNNGHVGIGLNPDSSYWLKVKGSAQFYNSAADTGLVVGNQGDGIYYNSIKIWSGYNGTYPMHNISQDTNGCKYTVGGTFYVIPASGAGGVYLTYGGTSWTSNSDVRLKNIIEPISSPLQKVMGLEPFIFSWKGDENNKRCVGLSAQSVEAVLPEVISKSKNTKDETDQTEYLGVQYTELIPLLTAAIQEQQALIQQLQADVAALKGAQA